MVLRTTVALGGRQEDGRPSGSRKKPQQLHQMRLEGRGRVLQDRDGETCGWLKTEVLSVIAPMPMCPPGPIGHPFPLPMCGEAALCADEAKRGYGGQPGKPVGRIGLKREQAVGGTDHHIVAIAGGLDERDDMGWLACWPGLDRSSTRPG